MLKVQAAPTFTVPVEISVAGQPAKEKLTVTFKHLGRKARTEYFKANAEAGDLEVLSGLIVTWEGADQPYSRDALESVLDGYDQAAIELVTAYLEAATGAARKNS